jgi:hypothetical protein
VTLFAYFLSSSSEFYRLHGNISAVFIQYWVVAVQVCLASTFASSTEAKVSRFKNSSHNLLMKLSLYAFSHRLPVAI